RDHNSLQKKTTQPSSKKSSQIFIFCSFFLTEFRILFPQFLLTLFSIHLLVSEIQINIIHCLFRITEKNKFTLNLKHSSSIYSVTNPVKSRIQTAYKYSKFIQKRYVKKRKLIKELIFHFVA